MTNILSVPSVVGVTAKGQGTRTVAYSAPQHEIHHNPLGKMKESARKRRGNGKKVKKGKERGMNSNDQ